LEQALVSQKSVLVCGDYDADGATATALIIRVLRDIGLKHIDFLVPNRFDFGYGLSPELVELAAESKPDLIITVDNGISSIDGVAAAREKGIQILVTDHHLPGAQLPQADAIVNPNQPHCEFPSKSLAGVGVVFYLMIAFRARLRTSNWFEKNHRTEPRLEQYLDIVALGTVADLVPLDSLNRILVSQGLKLIQSGRGNPGIKALLEISGRDIGQAKSSDLGFAVAPRINAAG
ncbi:MAG: DHH family phosphoesterase, partial [Pseudomonadales bacterium]